MSLLIISMFLCFSGVNVSAQPVINSVTPQENATGVYLRTVLSVNLSETAGDTMNVTILFVANNYSYNNTLFYNSSQTLTFPTTMLPLTPTTTYQFWVNVSNTTYTGNPSGIWVNNSFNFTTGVSSRARDSSAFNAQQIVLLGVLLIVMILGILLFVMDMIKEQKLDIKKLIGLVFIIIMLGVVAGFV